MKEMSSVGKVPIFQGQGAASQGYEQQVRLRMRMSGTEPSGRATALVLHMNSVARQVCLSAWGDHLGNTDGASRMLETPRKYVAPEDMDSIKKEVVRLMQFAGTTTPSTIIPRSASRYDEQR